MFDNDMPVDEGVERTRSRVEHKSAGIIDETRVKDGFVANGQVQWRLSSQPTRASSSGGNGRKHFRQYAGFIEIGDEPGFPDDCTIMWEPVLKLGAKSGEQWEREYHEPLHFTTYFRVEGFGTYRGKGAVAVTKWFTMPQRPHDEVPFRCEVLNVYVDGIGEALVVRRGDVGGTMKETSRMTLLEASPGTAVSSHASDSGGPAVGSWSISLDSINRRIKELEHERLNEARQSGRRSHPAGSAIPQRFTPHLGVTPVAGGFDNIGRLLDTMGNGYRYTPFELEDLREFEKIHDYEAIFLTSSGVPRTWLTQRNGKMERTRTNLFIPNEEVIARP